MSVVSFHCNACGRCCDSAPAMTVPELFHHEARFIGCLAIRRVPRWRAGDALPFGATTHLLTAEDVAEGDPLAERLLHTRHGRFSVGTQGYDEAWLGACPARAPDQRCGIHDDRKPIACRTVPLDPLWPDRLQPVVLMNRHLAGSYHAADCIVAGRRDGHAALVEDGAIVEPGYRADLDRHRDALALEKTVWADAIHDLLARELFADPACARTVPTSGYLSLPLVPVLAVLAARSERDRERCRRYVEAQRVLLGTRIDQALQRRSPQDRPMTRELRSFVQAYERLDEAWSRAAPPSVAGAVDAYLPV